MNTMPPLRVLFFDVFGTCVAQRGPVADELSNAAKEALESKALPLDATVMEKAGNMNYDDWFEFGGKWDRVVDESVRESIAQHGTVDWEAVDEYRIQTFCTMLTQLGLVLPVDTADGSKWHVKPGSLWQDSQLEHLARVWHRLPPWPDTCPGLEQLNQHFATVTLSNTYQGMIKDIVGHSSIPFAHVYSSDMFNSFKPNPQLYLGAAERMGVKPEECGLVAAHLKDLKGAKACGFFAIYVERPLEEKNPALVQESIPDLVIKQEDEGFVALAERLKDLRGSHV